MCVCVCVCHFSPQYTSLTFKRPTCAYVITHKKSPVEIHFKYLDNKEISSVLSHATLSLFYFPQDAMHFII